MPVRRGFTLVELMVVVAIVGVLSAIAIYGFRKYQLASKASEATGMLAGIRGAQESYKAENLTYVGCTTAGVTAGGNIADADLYPRIKSALNDRKMAWEQADSALTRCFRTLGARSDGPVVYSFGVASRAPGALTNVTFPVTFSRPLDATVTLREPFYAAVAVGNRDGDTIFSRAMTTSMQNEVHLEEDTE